MVPTAEVERSTNESLVGAHPRLVNKTMRICTARMKRNLADVNYPTTTVLFLNQTREKIGVMFGDPETTPGGKGKNFFAGVRLRLFASLSKKNRIIVKQVVNGVTRSELVARKIAFNVIKNKCGGIPFEAGELMYYVKAYKGNPAWTFDNELALFDMGRYYRLIEMTPKGQYRYQTLSGDVIQAKRPADWISALRNDPEAYDQLYTEIMEQVNNANKGVLVDSDNESVTEEEVE